MADNVTQQNAVLAASHRLSGQYRARIFEFIEIHKPTASPVDISGWAHTGSVDDGSLRRRSQRTAKCTHPAENQTILSAMRSFAEVALDCCSRSAVYPAVMSTVTEIKQAVSKLPPRKKLALALWLNRQVDDRLSDEAMMAIAAEGARALDKREAADAKCKTR